MVLSTIWLLNLLNVVYFPLLNKSWISWGKKGYIIIVTTVLYYLSNISLITAMLPLYLKRTWVQLHCSLDWNALYERHSIHWNIRERAFEDSALHFYWEKKPLLVFKSCLLPSFPHSPPSHKMVAEEYLGLLQLENIIVNSVKSRRRAGRWCIVSDRMNASTNCDNGN